MTLQVVYNSDDKSGKFRRLLAELHQFASYTGKRCQEEYAWTYEVSSTQEDFFSIFMTLGKYNCQPDHFHILEP
jgi:hypothetical protein